MSTPSNGAAFTTGQPITITGVASDSGGRVAGVEVSLDGGSTWHRATSATYGQASISWSYNWTPASAGTYAIRSRAIDDSLNMETSGSGPTITVTSFGSSLFLATDGPSLMNANDPSAIELGVKFTSSTAGNITGLRFYKNPIDFGSPNLPAHTVHLWSSSGTQLASATFTNETASGWQQVNLATPVSIAANTTYVVSYHSNGDYSETDGYFATAHANGSLTAPSSSSGGGNGVYRYGTGSSFPSASDSDSNYWVDVVFAASPVITSPLTASANVGVPFSYTITANNNPDELQCHRPAGRADGEQHERSDLRHAERGGDVQRDDQRQQSCGDGICDAGPDCDRAFPAGHYQCPDGKCHQDRTVQLHDNGDEQSDQLQRQRPAGRAVGQHLDRCDLRHADHGGHV